MPGPSQHEINERIALENFDRIMSGGNVFGCRPCLMIFNDGGMFLIHQSTHASPTQPFTCSCGQVLPNRYGFQIHCMLASHSEVPLMPNT